MKFIHKSVWTRYSARRHKKSDTSNQIEKIGHLCIYIYIYKYENEIRISTSAPLKGNNCCPALKYFSKSSIIHFLPLRGSLLPIVFFYIFKTIPFLSLSLYLVETKMFALVSSFFSPLAVTTDWFLEPVRWCWPNEPGPPAAKGPEKLSRNIRQHTHDAAYCSFGREHGRKKLFWGPHWNANWIGDFFLKKKKNNSIYLSQGIGQRRWGFIHYSKLHIIIIDGFSIIISG